MPKKKSDYSQMKKDLEFEYKSAWIGLNEKKVDEFSKEYIQFMSRGKTERTFAEESVKLLEKNGYRPIEKVDLKEEIKAYYLYRGKTLAIFRMPNKFTGGLNIIASHIDSPRIDLKPKPIYEDSNMVLAKTHYYGGIKKYQWFNIPLAIVGVVVKRDGKVVKIDIGNEPGDPVFVMSDLLPHLDRNENKKISDITGEMLNLIIGSKPITFEKMEGALKLNVLKLLNDKYGIVEEDLVSSELEIVPAFEPKEIGFDRSMIGAYGHDDKICAFASLKAILDSLKISRPTVILFFDKEEIGSYGSTGASHQFWMSWIKKILKARNIETEVAFEDIIEDTAVLSSDVNAAFDPTFKDVFEANNTPYLGNGVVITKYTGARGKAGSSDADAEFVGKIRKILNDNKVIWQTGELGKVDVGGGGTIALFFAEYGMHVLDVGPALLGMHSPFEIVSKADLYQTYLAYLAFIKDYE
ncbi:MAG: aminopeptidase [Athalassotoga sp.]|uniref:aminopeptidase n=1 Tax=Athalassotoga sp. TaxID=2022597 RepID=UPI003D01C05D